MTNPRLPSPMAAWTPLFSWSEILFKTAEMMMASGQVIGHRVDRMGRAGLSPSARDAREFTLMGQEKLEAAAESAQAMSLYWWQAQQQAGAKVFQQMMGMGPVWWAEPWKQAAHWSRSSTGLLNKGLAPIHSRATANARRLGSR